MFTKIVENGFEIDGKLYRVGDVIELAKEEQDVLNRLQEMIPTLRTKEANLINYAVLDTPLEDPIREAADYWELRWGAEVTNMINCLVAKRIGGFLPLRVIMMENKITLVVSDQKNFPLNHTKPEIEKEMGLTGYRITSKLLDLIYNDVTDKKISYVKNTNTPQSVSANVSTLKGTVNENLVAFKKMINEFADPIYNDVCVIFATAMHTPQNIAYARPINGSVYRDGDRLALATMNTFNDPLVSVGLYVVAARQLFIAYDYQKNVLFEIRDKVVEKRDIKEDWIEWIFNKQLFADYFFHP